jgi:3-oxoacyl-[acyl-carrier-protein] synthase-1
VREVVSVDSTAAICAVGAGLEQISASVRAGLSRIRRSSIHDRGFEPVRMALVPEDALPPLAEPLERKPLTARHKRMLRLAAAAFATAAEAPPAPAFIGVHEPESGKTPVDEKAFLEALDQQLAKPTLDLAKSHVVPNGRAAAYFALRAGLDALAAGAPTVLVGAVDTYLDLALLANLDAEDRILTERVMDGFIPGEGAAFLRLRSGPSAPRPAAIVGGATTEHDPGHRYSTAPHKGEGLSNAFAKLAAEAMPRTFVSTMICGLNGESYFAKEWGVAHLRAAQLFAPDMTFNHPADCWGDAGAATGALLLALASHDLATGTRRAPALTWASSDRGDVGCATLDVPIDRSGHVR